MRDDKRTFRRWTNLRLRYYFPVVGLVLPLLSGCLSPPKRLAWEISREDYPIVEAAERWTQLSTNLYVRVSEERRDDSVKMLQELPFTPLDSLQLATFAPSLTLNVNPELQPYLVRGVCYTSHPVYTVVRFDESKNLLLVQQATYNGEMLMPFRWVAEPNALVVFLRKPPYRVYSHALLGGDGIFRGNKLKRLDTR